MTINLAPDSHPPIALSDDETSLLAIARRVAEDSPDRSRKVGAVIIAPNGEIISVGCNTLPDGVEHSDEFLSRPAKYDWTEHAERNAIFEVAKSLGKSTEGCSMVLPWFPCAHCARAIVQAGIQRVVAPYPDVTDPNWGEEFKTALRMLEKNKVTFDHFIDDRPPPRPRAEGDHAESLSAEGRAPITAWVDHWNAHRAVLDESQWHPAPPRRPGMRR